MRYYIDFDSTLFNTKQFYIDLLDLVSEYGLNKNEIELCQELNFKDQLFNPLKIINYLVNKNNINSKIKDDITLFMNDISKYLYEDSERFLKYLKENNNELIILTYGDYEYQNEKICKSSIIKYFDKVIITSKRKCDLDIDYYNSVFIDDSDYQLEGLMKKGAKVIKINRLESDDKNMNLKNIIAYNNLDELIDNKNLQTSENML